MTDRIHDIYRPAEERIRDFKEVEIRLSADQIHEQMLRCHNCGIPFCHGSGCPLGNVIPDFNSAAASGDWRTAWDILSRTSFFPEFTSRVCPALCEGSCCNSVNDEAVMVRQCEKIIIETYVVRFLNDDSTQLQIDTLELGAMPKYRGSTPQKPDDRYYSYFFRGWQPEIVAVTSDATYVATYRAIPISALPDVPETHRPQKIFRDNQLYILLPNGTRYDSTGKKVE